MQATALNSTTATTVSDSGTAITVIPAVAANVHFLKDAITGVMSILGSIGMILAVVLVANGMGSEYSWNTIRPYLLCSESRLKMFTAKLIAAAVFIVAGLIIGLIIAILLGPGFQHGEFYRARITDFCAQLICNVTLYITGFSFYGIRAVDSGRNRVWYWSIGFRDYYHRLDVNGTRLAGKNTQLLAYPQYPED
jgi:ABC-type transport system involved in multi-copper enzyme maturation permease subunit